MLMPMLWNTNRNMWNDMDEMMNSFWGNSLNQTASMKTDVLDADDHYELRADLPGFSKEEIDLSLKDNALTISATHENHSDEKNEEGKYVRRERSYSSYSRTFTVGDGIRPEEISAAYENGVLSVTIPKKTLVPQKDEPKKIAIR